MNTSQYQDLKSYNTDEIFYPTTVNLVGAEPQTGSFCFQENVFRFFSVFLDLDLNIYLVSNFLTHYIHYKLEIRLAVPHVGYFVIWSGVTKFGIPRYF